jgi:hypothetical protein
MNYHERGKAMRKFLVRRYGNHEANQPATYQMPLCVLTAKNREDAVSMAQKCYTVYENQFLLAEPWSAASAQGKKDWLKVEYNAAPGDKPAALGVGI